MIECAGHITYFVLLCIYFVYKLLCNLYLRPINETVQYGKENLIKKLQKMNITQIPSLRKRFHRAKNGS